MVNDMKITPFFMEGEWCAVGIEALHYSGWVLLREYAEKEYPWTFRTDSILVQSAPLEEPMHSMYHFNPSDRLLSVNDFDICIDGEHHSVALERYRVEVISMTEVLLYDLEDVSEEPGEYYLRIRLRREPFRKSS